MNGSTDVDRLSDLPEVILHHILSFLNMKQVGETSVLSKRWRYLGAKLPYLNFDKELVESFNLTKKEPMAFIDFLHQVLIKRPNTDLCIQKFHLYCPEVNFIDAWIAYCRHRNVQEISIVMGYTCLNNRKLHCLSGLFKYTTSLKVLELLYINAPLKLILPRIINLPVLHTLLLHGLSLDDTFDKLFYACPILESLTIKNCSIHFSHLNISSPKLRELVIDNDCSGDDHRLPLCAIKVCAPNLLSFHCKDNMLMIDYSLENLSSLVKADIYFGREGGLSAKEEERADETSAKEEERADETSAKKEERYTGSAMEVLRAVQKVTTLTLSGPGSIFQAFSEPDALQGTQFCNLRCLKVCAKNSKNSSNWIKGVTCLLKISPNIESVSLTGEMSDSEYEEARLSLGTLKHLKFAEFKNPFGGIARVNDFKFRQPPTSLISILWHRILYLFLWTVMGTSTTS